MLQLIVILLMIVGLNLAFPKKVSAHCDTMDGPTAIDGVKALETKNINYALKWVMPESEEELTNIFKLSLKVRHLNDDAKKLADRYFLENLVRIHRAGEGASFTGLKPTGVPIDEKVAAADKCIETGNITFLKGLVAPEEMSELEKRLQRALSLKDYDLNDVQAGREYINAYVSFFKFAEGEEHEHHEHHEHL
ncbi:MAG: DUF6448 family protein [Bacillota bacterium]|nr:DUF6448 family protein [Bacillota bacterium]